MLDNSASNFPVGNLKNVEYQWNSLWISSKVGTIIRLYRYQNNVWTEYTIPNPDAVIYKINPSKYSEEVFLCTSKGLFNPISGLVFDSLNSNLPSNKINDCYEPDEQTLLIATQWGMVKLNGGNVIGFNYPNSPIENKQIKKIAFTNYHGIIISSNVGSFKFDNSSNNLAPLTYETSDCLPLLMPSNVTYYEYNDSNLCNGSFYNFMVVDKTILRFQPNEYSMSGISNYNPLTKFNPRIDQTTGKSWYLANSNSSFLFAHYKNTPFYS